MFQTCIKYLSFTQILFLKHMLVWWTIIDNGQLSSTVTRNYYNAFVRHSIIKLGLLHLIWMSKSVVMNVLTRSKESRSEPVCCFRSSIDNAHGPDAKPHRRIPHLSAGPQRRWWGRRWRQAKATAWTALFCRPQPRQSAKLWPAIFIAFAILLQQRQHRGLPKPTPHHQQSRWDLLRQNRLSVFLFLVHFT